MPKAIPEQLKYLQPAIGQLESFDSESLGDDNPEAMEIVAAALRQRLHGMSVPDAKTAVRQDSEVLKDWLTDPELSQSPGHYVYGTLVGISMYADMREFVQ